MRSPREDGGRDWNNIVTSQGIPQIAGSHLKLRERHEMEFSPLNLQREHSSSNNLDFRLLASRTVRKIFVVLSHQSVTEATGNYYK